jgi:hypothetical protein
VDWTNYQTAGTYSILVRNSANVDLVAFKDSLKEENKLGGVPKGGGTHGFKMNEALFSTSADFSIIFLTPEKYTQNKSNLSALTQTPFTRIFAVYNKQGSNEKAFEISGKLGGTNPLVINNMTGYNVELRENGPFGPTIGYAPEYHNQTTLFIAPNELQAFFVFKKYNPVRDEMITVFPKTTGNKPQGDAWSWENGDPVTINAAKYAGEATLTSGAAVLIIVNASGRGIQAWKGTTVQKTASGIATINDGGERSYTILMEGNAGNYESSRDLIGWKIVNPVTNEEIAITQFTMDSDYRYTIVVGDGDGDCWNAGVGGVEISEPEKSEKKITEDVIPAV